MSPSKKENGKFEITDVCFLLWGGNLGKFNQNKFQIADLIKCLFVQIEGMTWL